MRRDSGWRSVFDVLRFGAAVYASTVTRYCPSQSVQIFQDMELRLSGKAECHAGIECVDRCALEQPRIGQAGQMRGFELVHQHLALVTITKKEEAIESLKITIDVFELDYRFDSLNRSRV